jgi:hypothetical protein
MDSKYFQNKGGKRFLNLDTTKKSQINIMLNIEGLKMPVPNKMEMLNGAVQKLHSSAFEKILEKTASR